MLSKLANRLPISQGRHSGEKIGKLRPAKAEELAEARRIAQSFIEKYLDYLERQNPAK